MKQIALQPELSRKEAKERWEGRYLSHGDYRLLIEEAATGRLPDGQLAFLYLPRRVPKDFYLKSGDELARLPFHGVGAHRLLALGSSTGSSLTLGWWDYGRGPELTRVTRLCGDIYREVLCPLAEMLSGEVRKHLPDIYRAQLQRANRSVHIGSSLFSTITVNHNTICRAHPDGGNEEGISCLTTFVEFGGMELAFPRLDVAFPLQPGDVLVAATGLEVHGNVGPLGGDRISTVFYSRPGKRI